LALSLGTMPPGAVLAATAHDASRSHCRGWGGIPLDHRGELARSPAAAAAAQGQDFEDQFGWHNSPLRPPATLRKETTMLHKQAVEWPKPGDIVLDAVFKKVWPGTLAHARTSFACTQMSSVADLL